MSRHNTETIKVSEWLARSVNHCLNRKSPFVFSEATQHQVVKRLQQAFDLCHAPDCDEEERIHSIRVYIKQLRAYGRLLRYAVDEEVFRHTDKQLKQVANSLSTARDQHVLLASLTSLVDEYTELNEVLHFLNHQIKTENEPAIEPSIDWEDISQQFLQLRTLWLSVVVREQSQMTKGLLKTYRKSRIPNPFSQDRQQFIEQRHEWRKWVKHSLYQLKFLKKTHCFDHKVIKKQIIGLDNLGEILGQEHDFELLQDFLELKVDWPATYESQKQELLLKNQKRIKALNKEAVKVAKKLKTVKAHGV